MGTIESEAEYTATLLSLYQEIIDECLEAYEAGQTTKLPNR